MIDDNQFQAVIQSIRQGLTVQAALDAHKVTRYHYDKARYSDPIKSQAHARARQDGVDAMADDIPHIADSEGDAQRARNRIDARKWLCGVIKPREYGQRLDLVVTPNSDPAALDKEGRERVRLLRDLPPALGYQPIEDAAIIGLGATGSASVAPPAGLPADVRGTIFE